MSGGAFDYKQHHLTGIAEAIEQSLRPDSGYGFTPETVAEFKHAVGLLKRASVYVDRIDYLLSGDDGEESFHERLSEELSVLHTPSGVRHSPSEPLEDAALEGESEPARS